MKLLCVIDCNPDLITGYVECKDEYLSFVLHKGSEAVIDGRFPKKNYKSYAQFAAITGKQDPWAFMLRKPIPIKGGLDFDRLSDIYRSTPALRVWEQPSCSE